MLISSDNLLQAESEKIQYCYRRHGKNSFTKYLAWSLKQIYYGLLVSISQKKKNRTSPNTFTEKNTDVLILHPSEKSKEIGAKDRLIQALIKRGLNISHEIMQKEKSIIELALYTHPVDGALRLRVYEGYANYLKQTYQPKIIITERNGSILSTFLKSKNPRDSKTFHLAHSVLSKESSHYELIDYDYYCIYGPSSMQYLKNLEYKYGRCEIIPSGGYLFGSQNIIPVTPTAPVLLLGSGPDYEDTNECKNLYDIIRNWQQKTSEDLLIRLHPRSKGQYWKNYVSEKVKILPQEAFNKSAQRCSIVLASYTNAVLDAALIGKPIQLLASPNSTDHLDVEKFFNKGASEENELEKKIDDIRNNYNTHIEICNNFIKYHLYNPENCIESICNSIENILDNSFDS